MCYFWPFLQEVKELQKDPSPDFMAAALEVSAEKFDSFSNEQCPFADCGVMTPVKSRKS